VVVWLDIENEPQVQYLLPVAEACSRAGSRVLVTVRDYGAAFEQIERRGVDYHPIGKAYGSGRYAKVRGLVARTRELTDFLKREGPPDRLVSASRAGVLAARRLGTRSYVISDYEHANLTVFRWAGSTVLFPDVIDPERYRSAGFSPERLVPFHGLKEDLTFAGIDLDSTQAAALDDGRDEAFVKVLVRPPAEDSHYYVRRSTNVYLELLRFLARDERVVVVLAPRYARQAADLREVPFANEPIVLARSISFVSLLKAVDLVVTSGGTMLREAAYLGIPAYSIFGGRIGEVDRFLAAQGRATLLESADQLDRIKLEKASGLRPLALNPTLVDDLARIVMA
jgi:uncharacterized protein